MKALLDKGGRTECFVAKAMESEATKDATALAMEIMGIEEVEEAIGLRLVQKDKTASTPSSNRICRG